ncbi:hypothetical protein [Brevundimonas sp.]|uniref:hypothetical protein n=1 Tax=Brevundimonas sp. TaxID=1871086 RepID=UPI002FC8030D
MTQRLPNAGFLDLAQGWTASSALALSVDETTRGAPGRQVLRGTGTAASDGFLTLQPATASRPSAAHGEMIEAQAFIAAHVAGVASQPTARLVFRDGGGSQISALDIPVRPALLSLHGEGVAGLTDTFRRAYLRAAAPSGTATATLEARASATTGQAVDLAILKPLVGPVPATRAEPLLWSPGIHVEEDLQLDVWPSLLKPFQARSTSEPQAGRVEFTAMLDRPVSRRTSADPARRFDGLLRCDPVQRAILETFARTAGDFWIVEPDSERLCVGSFAADGAPRLVEDRGPTVIMGVGLWLETA